MKRHGAERFYAAFFLYEALQINGSTDCSSARRRQTLHKEGVTAPKTHVQTSQASRGTRPASYVRTSAALGKFQARACHDAHHRSSTLPRQRRGTPLVAEAFLCSSRGRAAGRRTEPHPNENRLVAPRAALGRFSRRRCGGDEACSRLPAAARATKLQPSRTAVTARITPLQHDSERLLIARARKV